MYDITAIGGAMRDIIFYTEEGLLLNNPKDPLCEKVIAFESGAKIYIKEVYFEIGGGAVNSGVGLSKLGLKTAVVVKVGQDREGDALIKETKKQGVDVHFVQRDKKISTGFSFILTLLKKRAHTIFTYHGASDYLQFPSQTSHLLSTRWLYLSSLGCLDWPAVFDKIFEFKVRNKTLLAWNPSNIHLKAGYKKLSKYLKLTDVFILNEDEARELVLSEKKETGSFVIRRLLREIRQMGVKIPAITVGAKGAYAYDGLRICYQKEMPAKVINTTGAGDAFSSGFIASLIYKPSDIQRALHWGVANSTSVIKKIGAQRGLLNKKQICSC